MSDKRVVIRVSSKTAAALKAFAAARDIDVGTAADRMVATAAGRIKAATKYARSQTKKPARVK